MRVGDKMIRKIRHTPKKGREVIMDTSIGYLIRSDSYNE